MNKPNRSIKRRQLLASLSAIALAFPLPGLASNQSAYPSRPVTLIVPFAPGGGTDIVARLLAEGLAKHWDSPVVVENRPGAGGRIGNTAVARSKPDGYTLLLGITTLIQAPKLYNNLPYDVFKDFTPIAQLATSVNFLVVPANSPATTVKEFLTLAKANPGKYSYGSNGPAGTSHLHGALFNSSTGLDMVHVPYPGSSPLITALLSQQVEAAFVDIAPLRPHAEAGKLRPLASTGTERSSAFPQVPTLTEEGLAGFEPVGWFGLFGPGSMPAETRKLIADATSEVTQTPEFIARVEGLGLTPSRVAQEEFDRVMREDKPKWEKMIDAGNIRVE